jgi:hypothetical protein
VGAVAEKWGNAFGTYPIPLEESEWESDDESDDEWYETTSDEPSDHSSTSTEQPPQPAPSQRRPKIMTPEKIKSTKIIMGVGLLTAAILGAVDWSISLIHSNSSAS